MAEEANAAMSAPTTSDPKIEPSQQDSGAEAADITMDEGTSEPNKEGPEQEEGADDTSSLKQSYSENRLTIVFFQPPKPTATRTTPPMTSPPLPPRTHKILKCKTRQRRSTPRELNLLQPYLPQMAHPLRPRE